MTPPVGTNKMRQKLRAAGRRTDVSKKLHTGSKQKRALLGPRNTRRKRISRFVTQSKAAGPPALEDRVVFDTKRHRRREREHVWPDLNPDDP